MDSGHARCRARLRAVVGALGFLAALIGRPSEVEACSPAPLGWIAGLQNTELPSDGYLLVRLYCSVNCGAGPTEPSITVREVATGAEVPGSVARLPDVDESQNVYAWRGTNPLVAGGDYEVEVKYQTLSRPATFPISVVAAGRPDFETMGLETTIGPLEVEAGEETCCPGGPFDTCGDKFCFRDQVERSVWIMHDWSLTADAARFGQYVSRVIWEGRSEIEPWRIGLAAVGNFETSQTEYCSTLELKSLIDGSIERLDRGCIAHPDGLELGVFDVEQATLSSQLGVCDEPPEGKRAEWCDARDDSEQSCRDADRGCSVAAAGVARRGGAIWLLALLAVGLVVRRSRVNARVRS